jgi:hypothetical protein
MVIALDRSSAAPNLPPVLPDKVSGPPFGLGVVAGPVSLCPARRGVPTHGDPKRRSPVQGSQPRAPIQEGQS